MNESVLKELCDAAREAYRRGDAHGTTGNVSLRVEDAVWITPAGTSLQNVSPLELACVGLSGEPRGSNRASSELPLHLSVYAARPEIAAVVHLHAPHAVALSCLDDLNPEQPLPPFTFNFQTRVAPLGLVPSLRPGTPELSEAVGQSIRRHNCLLLRNHGLLCVSRSLQRAVDRAVELEETARLFFLLRGMNARPLSSEDASELVDARRSVETGR